MKKALAILFLSLLSLTASASPELTLKQKLVAAEAATALITGPIVLPVALATGRGKELCMTLEGPWVKPTSYDPNSDGRDQCPKGNWLRILTFLGDLKND